MGVKDLAVKDHKEHAEHAHVAHITSIVVFTLYVCPIRVRLLTFNLLHEQHSTHLTFGDALMLI
jgi:hypothetical protein